MKVEIVTCYKAGTMPIMRVWGNAVSRYTSGVDYGVTVLVKDGEKAELAGGVPGLPCAVVEGVAVGADEVSVARVHGRMLDAYVPAKVDADVVCTMDSDCFPVADGWLQGLLRMLDEGCAVAGILHPWAPPPEGMPRSKVEWRVRTQHCWLNTHVACQALRTALLGELGVTYSGGDDTGLLVPKVARERGMKVSGYMPTRCPRPWHPAFDAEFNRYVSLVYGDKLFHLGGYTRVSMGDKDVYAEEFGWAKERVLEERGAEFLLDDALSHRFSFVREEQVAKEKMDRIFGTQDGRMLGK